MLLHVLSKTTAEEVMGSTITGSFNLFGFFSYSQAESIWFSCMSKKIGLTTIPLMLFWRNFFQKLVVAFNICARKGLQCWIPVQSKGRDLKMLLKINRQNSHSKPGKKIQTTIWCRLHFINQKVDIDIVGKFVLSLCGKRCFLAMVLACQVKVNDWWLASFPLTLK